MKTSIRSLGITIFFVTIFWPTVNRNLASAQDNPYKFERPLSVSDYFSHRSNDGLFYISNFLIYVSGVQYQNDSRATRNKTIDLLWPLRVIHKLL